MNIQNNGLSTSLVYLWEDRGDVLELNYYCPLERIRDLNKAQRLKIPYFGKSLSLNEV